MKVLDAMISDAIMKKAGYKCYMAKNVESEKAKIVDKLEEKHVSPIKSRRGKGFMCYGDQVANVPNKLKKDDVPKKTRSLTITEEAVVGQLANSIVEDPAVQSLLDLRKGSKASRLESLRQKKQLVAGERSSVTHNKYYSSSDTTSNVTLHSSSLDELKESANETNDADKSDMDLSYDNLHGDDDASSSLDFIQTLLDETLANELTDFMSHLVYTDAQKTSVVHNPEGDPVLTSYISCASEVPLDIDKDENHILGPLTAAIAKKFKELIQKDELSIADLEGAGLERLKVQYNNDVELEYHVSQLKAAVLSEAQWSSDEGDVSKPKSFERHMSKIEMSRDVLTFGSTMRILLLYRGEYSQWVERFMNYLEEQTDGEAMINSIKNGDQPLPRVTQYATMMRHNKNLMDINIDALYNILKQNQRDVNDDMGSKKKTVVVTSDPLALIAEKTKVSKSKEKVIVSSDSEGKFVKTDNKKVEKKDDEKKRYMSRVKCYNCKKEGHFAKDCKKVKVKDYEYYKTKMRLAKKYKDEQVLLAEDQAWMESSSDSNQEINANMVFMAQIEKVLFDLEASSSSADEKISEVSYYLSDSESESEFETSEYYDNSTNYGLFMNNDDDQEIFHDAIESASEKFIENHIDSQKDNDKSDVDHNDSEEKDHLVDKLIRKFNKMIVKYQKRVEKANQQSKDFENQNKDLHDKNDVLKN
nr:hypothetical protein [Tanacetum cinerariifolium]